MKTSLFTTMLTITAALMWPDAVRGQAGATCPDDTAIDNLRERRPTDLDNRIIDEWLAAAYADLKMQVTAGTDAAAAGQRFVACVTAQYTDETNSIEFNRRFAERVAEIVLPEYRKGAELGAPVARALAGALANLRAEPTREALLVGLGYPDQVVRYQSATALEAIRADISADARLAGVTLTQLGQACAAEVNDVVAAQIYRACAYPEHRDAAVGAMLAGLDGRLAKMRSTGRGFGRAELVAIRFLDSLSLESAQRVELVQRLAPLMRLCVVRFGEEDVSFSEKTALEELIDEAEGLIRKLVNPSNGPNVSEKMQRGGDAVAVDMQIDLNLWIGTAQDEGVLNRAPWSISRGAP